MPQRRPSPLTFRAVAALFTLSGLGAALPGLAAQAPFAVVRGKPTAKVVAATKIAAVDQPAALASLFPATWEEPDRVLDLGDRNAAGRLPMQDGFARPLPEVSAVRLDARGRPALSPGGRREHAGGLLTRDRRGGLRWAARVEVAEAWRLRLELTDVQLPRGAELWVVGGDGEAVGPFGIELADRQGTLWTPSVAGPSIAVEVHLSRQALADRATRSVRRGEHGFRIGRVLEEFALDARGVPLVTTDFKGEECQVDAQCVGDDTLPGIDTFQRAVAHIKFVKDGGSFICSGGLLNDTDPSGVVPYFLTANHCISEPAVANTVQAYFDYETANCNAASPGLAGLPRVGGATLLATSEDSDFTLLRLSSAPPGARTYLGWTTLRQPVGSEIHRIAHPSGKPQVYSRSRIVDETSQFRCTGLPLAGFYYSDETFSGTAGGSSGGVSFTAEGQVVGQLFGRCGTDNDDPCAVASQDQIDGYFGASYPAIAQFLDPPTGAACRPDATTLCFLGGRYEAKLDWRNPYAANESGVGGAIRLTDLAGLFYFSNPENIEMMVKVLDFGGGVVKVFYGQLTDFDFSLRLRDTATGRTKIYTKTPGNCGAIDQSFLGIASDVIAEKSSTPDAPAMAPCAQSDTRLCLLGNRFAVEATWRNPFNDDSGAARTPRTPLSGLSGTFSYQEASNVELLVKTLDFGDRILFIWGALSDFEYTITVTDTQTGRVKTYFNPPQRYCGGLDNDFEQGGGGTTLTESEPNNTQATAQTLAGESPITLFGRAEKGDLGTLSFRSGTSSDDLEDLYRVSIGSAGLKIVLSELGADCDLYLYDNNGVNLLGSSNAGDFVDETIDLPNLAPGNYLIAVSIWDAGGDPDSNYRLTVEGDI